MHEWRVAQAEATGTSHLADSTPCQDMHLVDRVFDGDVEKYLLIAVADGAGSAPLSRLGAQTACIAAIRCLKSNIGVGSQAESFSDCMREAFAAAIREIEGVAMLEGVDAQQLACTLLVAAVGETHGVFGQVGDGAIVCGEPGALRVIHWAEQAALNVTDFLTSAPLEETLHVAVEASAIRRVACLTDGLSLLLLDYREKTPHAPAFERLFAACATASEDTDLSRDLARFLDSPQVNERTDDDKTLVLAVRGVRATDGDDPATE